MVDEEALPNPSPGVYLYPGKETVKVGYKTTHKLKFMPPEKASHAVKPDSMKARVAEDYLPPISSGRIPGKDCPYILPEGFKQFFLILLVYLVF
jgi:hypothetical protein